MVEEVACKRIPRVFFPAEINLNYVFQKVSTLVEQTEYSAAVLLKNSDGDSIFLK